MSDDSSWVVLLSGPAGGAGFYWLMYRYYRNTDKSHDYEHETKIVAQPVTGSDQKVDTNNGTQQSRIEGSNESDYRKRVERMRNDSA